MQNHFKGSHFGTVEVIQKVRVAVLNSLKENAFWKCFDSLKQRWNLCIAAGGNDSERDHCSSE
jgi:hypothetical protein